MDARYQILKERLQSLTVEQLKRVLDYPDEMIVDEYNFYEGKFCPLAVAFDLPNIMQGQTITNDTVRNKVKELGELQMCGFEISPTKGVKGEFYVDNRKEDLLNLAREVLIEKESVENGI